MFTRFLSPSSTTIFHSNAATAPETTDINEKDQVAPTAEAPASSDPATTAPDSTVEEAPIDTKEPVAAAAIVPEEALEPAAEVPVASLPAPAEAVEQHARAMSVVDEEHESEAETVAAPAVPAKEQTLHQRMATAEAVIPPEEQVKILKTEVKDAKRLSKIIKDEAKAEDKLLKTAIKELDRMQKTQKAAAADEADAITAHAKAARAEQKMNKVLLEAKAKYELAVADLNAKTERVSACREHTEKQANLLKEKSEDVNALRAQKAAEDRERQARLAALKNPALAAVVA